MATQWPLKSAPHLTSLAEVCVVWRPERSLELSALRRIPSDIYEENFHFNWFYPKFTYWTAFPVGSIHILVRFYVCETTRCASIANFIVNFMGFQDVVTHNLSFGEFPVISLLHLITILWMLWLYLIIKIIFPNFSLTGELIMQHFAAHTSRKPWLFSQVPSCDSTVLCHTNVGLLCDICRIYTHCIHASNPKKIIWVHLFILFCV